MHLVHDDTSSGQMMCLPTCIHMILKKYGYHVDPVQLIQYLDFRVPADLLAEYPGASISDNPEEWGANPRGDLLIKKAFIEENIDMYVVEVGGDDIPRSEYLDFIKDNLDENTSILVGLWYDKVFGMEHKHVRHVCILQSIEKSKEKIGLVDPDFPSEIVDVKIQDIMHGAISFWLISPQSNKFRTTYI